MLLTVTCNSRDNVKMPLRLPVCREVPNVTELQEVERTEKGRVVNWKIISSSLLIFEGTGFWIRLLGFKILAFSLSV